MTWFHWLVIAIWAIGPIGTIARIGNQRKPLDKADAVIHVILGALLIWGMVHFTRASAP